MSNAKAACRGLDKEEIFKFILLCNQTFQKNSNFKISLNRNRKIIKPFMELFNVCYYLIND